MYKIQSVVDHIVETYGFEVSPCLIPRSDFQYLKRDFYIFILRHVSEKLFYFLRDKISPIKYREERPDGSIWLRKRDDNGLIFYEIEIRPVPAETTIYITDLAGIFKPILDDTNYKIKIYTKLSSVEDYTFPFNYKCGEKSIDFHFSKFSELKTCLRDKKLKSIL